MINFDLMPLKQRNMNREVFFTTARSGGPGGQHVNKTATKVEAWWHVAASALFSSEEKQLISIKLKHRINKDGFLIVTSSETRSQAENKQRALKKMEELVQAAIIVPKKREPSQPSKSVKERRIASKRKLAEKKQSRRGLDWSTE